MPKKAKAKAKPKAKKKQPASRRRAAASAGPLTLEEAYAVVRARSPKRTVRRAAASSAAMEVTPESVGKARRDVDKQYDQEIERRTAEYKATLTLLKKRGVKGLTAEDAPGRVAGARRRATGAGQPLQVFAEGDSWFHYPVFLRGGIIPRLEKRLGVPILNLAKAGDETRYMLGVKQRKIIAAQFDAGCPAGGDWDAMLFSGGGNDIVEDPMALWIRDYDPSIPVEDHVDPERFGAALSMVRFAYQDLITLRNDLSPNTQLVFHGYDFAIPSGEGVCFLGPWLEPTFDLRKFPLGHTRFLVVKAMLQQFAEMLSAIEKKSKHVTFLNGQGTLPVKESSWHNELHPSKDGFNKFADLFHAKLKLLFPAHVL